MCVKRDKYELEWIVVLMSTNSKFEINTSDTIKCISSSEDGRKIAFANNSGDIFLVDNEGQAIWEKNIGDGTYGIAIMKDGKRVICGGKDCKLRMFNSLGNVEWEVNVGKAVSYTHLTLPTIYSV